MIMEVLQRAKDLIESGKKEFLKLEKRTKYYRDSEYYIVYSKAVQFLLDAYNIETEHDITRFFESHIPKLFENKDCEESSEHFENLENEVLELRLKASKYFRGKALQETSGYRSILFNRPDTFEKLFNALKNEKNEKVIINLIITLGGAHNRYFKHFRVYENLSPYFHHKKSEVKYYTIIWTRFIENENKAKTLEFLQQQKQSKKVAQLLEEYIHKDKA